MIDYRIELVKDGFDYFAALTPIVGLLITLYIAFRQEKLATAQQELYRRNTQVDERNFKLSMYDLRKKVYESIQQALAYVLREGEFTNEELRKFISGTAEAQFLFDGEEIKDEVEIIRKKLIKLMVTRSKYKDLPVGEERTRLVGEESDLLEWLYDEFSVVAKVFAKYLKID